MSTSPREHLDNWKSFLGIDTCPCCYDWRPLGWLYGVSMGHGWVRLTTEPACSHHGTERTTP